MSDPINEHDILTNPMNPVVDVIDFLADLAAATGIIPVPGLAVVETKDADMLAQMNEHGGPIPFVCRAVGGLFFQNGIEQQTHSVWGHMGIFNGQKFGQIIRTKCPYLLKPRPWPGLITDHDIMLPSVPANAKPNEVIQSSITVTLDDWNDSIHPGIQAVAFLRDWNDVQIAAILESSYQMYGAPYDVTEIIHDVWPMVPNPPSLNACSSFTVRHLAKGDDEIKPWFSTNKLDFDAATPSNGAKYLFQSNKYPIRLFFRCDAKEAIAKS